MNAPALERTVRAAANFVSNIGAYVILPLLAIVIAVDVSMRYFVGRPIFGAVEASEFLLLIFFTLGMTLTTHLEKHIRMDLLFHGMPRGLKLAVEVLTLVCGLIFFGAIAFQSWHDIAYSRLISERSEELRMLLWPFHALVMVVFAMLCFQLVALTVLKFIAPETLPDSENTETWFE